VAATEGFEAVTENGAEFGERATTSASAEASGVVAGPTTRA
jgi:hypothetical protein